jgi:hypothetical protein
MIKIEVTGNSIPEVADKLIAIGNSLRQTTTRHIAVAVDAAQAEEITAAAAEIAQTKRRKVKAENPMHAAGTAENEPSVSAATGVTSAETVSTTPPSDEEASKLDYTKHVMPAVLRAVETQGRERVIALLSSMGVDKASQLPESRWPELMKALNA